MAELSDLGLFEENRTQRCRSTRRNMASLDRGTRAKLDSPDQHIRSIAGNATSRSEAETSPSSTRKWILPDVGFKNGRRTVKSKAKEGLEGLKTGKIAQKLGEIAVANDLAYIPRMADDALVGINEDETHSRESYVQVHHAAIDFTRQLPKGTQPAYYNPDTHILVPRRDETRPHTIQPLQAEQLQEPTFDLLDMEFMANKPRTVPAVMPSITVSTVEDTDNTRFDATWTRRYINPGPTLQHPVPQQTPILPGKTQHHTTQRPANSTQRPLTRHPTPTTQSERTSTRNAPKSHEKPRLDDHSELFLSPPPTFQDHPAYDVLHTNENPPVLPPIQTNMSRPHSPRRSDTTSSQPTDKSRPRPAKPSHRPQPPATWAAPIPSPTRNPFPTVPHKPATIIPLPFNSERDPGPKTPPLSLEEVETFSPKHDQLVRDFLSDLARSNSQERRQRSKSMRRTTAVHRKKTSQEIWEGKFEAERVSARGRLEGEQGEAEEEKQQQQQQQHEEIGEVEKKEVETWQQRRERQAREKAEFERRHQERLAAMQAEIAQDEKRAKVASSGNTEGVGRFRPTARTFQPSEREHRVRTKTQMQMQNGNNEKESHEALPPQMRATAKTFHMDQDGHQVRSDTNTDTRISQQQQQQQQQQPNTDTDTPTNTERPTQPSPEFRRWQPNPNARTFETMQSAGVEAARKRWRKKNK